MQINDKSQVKSGMLQLVISAYFILMYRFRSAVHEMTK